ncbi:hypothetical protein C8Q79DRAFT_513423 [Trametes meyenii]|nr:hypothetical protein C8Q79DRAFT_513423 [Trametes meyenii]
MPWLLVIATLLYPLIFNGPSPTQTLASSVPASPSRLLCSLGCTIRGVLPPCWWHAPDSEGIGMPHPDCLLFLRAVTAACSV